MKKFITLAYFTLFLLLTALSTSQAQLQPGDIAIIRLDEDAIDGFSFVALADIPNGTQMYFTEDGWTGTGWLVSNTEPHYLYTSPGLSAGDVVHVEESGTADVLTVTGAGGTMSLATGANFNYLGGDQVIVYRAGSGAEPANPVFITAFNSDDGGARGLNNSTGWLDADPTMSGSQNSALPTGLVNGETAMGIYPYTGVSYELDNVVYNGTLTTGTKAELLAAIYNPDNWTKDNTTRFGPAAAVSSFTVNPTLPLVLGDFTGTYSNSQVQLKWFTHTETNTSRFEIQRSANGVDFIPLHNLASAGNSDIEKHYSYTDPSPLAGRNYYRLKMIDLDESFTFSPTVMVSTREAMALSAATAGPGSIRIVLAGGTAEVYQVVDMNGKTRASGNLRNGLARVDALPRGVYIIRIIQPGKTLTASVVVL